MSGRADADELPNRDANRCAYRVAIAYVGGLRRFSDAAADAHSAPRFGRGGRRPRRSGMHGNAHAESDADAKPDASAKPDANAKPDATPSPSPTPTDNPPTAVDDNLTALFGTATDSAPGVLGNDTDPDIGDTLSVYSVNGSTANVGADTATTGGGTIHLNTDGSYTYTSSSEDTAFGGEDLFTYVAQDNDGMTSNTATASIDIIGICEAGSGPISASGAGTQNICSCEAGTASVAISRMFGPITASC